MNYEMLVRLLLAVLWGGMVGAEREYRGKSAGFRTMITISMGSCFFTMMSLGIGANSSPDRIASNIVTGIGFLGAGVIFRGDNRVNGITTAASIWAVAAVGMGIGAGYYWAAAFASVLILIVLAVLPRLETIIDKLNQSKTYTVSCSYAPDAREQFESLFRQHALKCKAVSETKTENDLSITWFSQGYAVRHEQFIKAMMHHPAVKRFEY
ncbi:MgtC/SapB family protein [Paraflavitalea soli]|uniref:MgtC/SapB family protein n=1 Tax=Paraflavitalea soli TaxID=2315862 RepID=A0A3B7N1V9_9BACT|nr:MgtC/SapB family protein [Paraflavitalea soli]AXY76351.1 MgtC/SapB family protein [Paraflavitalea soli]